jgi:coproporphyrinogen III oxidase-like Fe-S oxidoreductase
LQRYEVSAFAREGHRCRHNLNYWQFGDYLGLGAGAHGKLSFLDRIVRQVRWRDPATYMRQARAGQAVSNEQVVGAEQLPFEFMLNALRLADGFDLGLLAERTGLSQHVVDTALQQAQARGWLQLQGRQLKPTARGYDFLSDVQQLFLADQLPGRAPPT